jgi:hypothetical protein
MDGGNDPRFEIWLDQNGLPHIINYVGPPYNPLQRFLKKGHRRSRPPKLNVVALIDRPEALRAGTLKVG